MAELPLPRFSEIIARSIATATFVDTVELLFKALAERADSEELREVLYRAFYERGKRLGEKAPLERLGLSSDAMGIAVFPHLSDEGMQIEGTIVEASPTRVVKEVTKCPMQHISADLCHAYDGMMLGMVEGMNPAYKCSLPQCLSRGDSVCRVVVEKK
ncbi:MAG: hypothetical protein HYZ28_19895 [Myxococcales bacterium]|nr:hypothetical protein [Myxococcales bacterium]